jgi:hypothetical protein
MTDTDPATNGAGAHGAVSEADLRALVREILGELRLRPPGAPAAAGSPGAAPESDDAGAPRPVRLSTDEELRSFVLMIVRMADNSRQRRDLLAGRLRFTLGGPGAGVAGAAAEVRRIERGAVTERAVADAARDGARLVLGRRAVLTPLARDKARALGVQVERER